MTDYWLHQTVWDPDVPSGCYESLLNQMRYPELYSLSKALTSSDRPYWEMARIEQMRSKRADWMWVYFRYPSTFTTPIDTLWGLYHGAMGVNPEANQVDAVDGPLKIKRFIGIIARQREFVTQFVNAYIARTKTYSETMYNRAQDEEQLDGIVASVWEPAYTQWQRI